MYNKSRVMGDYQARFCERLKGKFLRPTRRFLRVCLESTRENGKECCTKDGSPLSGDKTKAGAERTGNGISIINKGTGLLQTTFRGSLQTTLCCAGRKLPGW